jgi:transcriptional regulator with XRE-family HTH domain
MDTDMTAAPDPRTGKRIAERRRELGLSQRQLATEHVSYAYISRIEAGKRRPSWSALIALAAKLGTTALFLGTGRTKGCPVCGR